MKTTAKANIVGTASLGVLSLRIIDTVVNSGIESAKLTKQFLKLVEVNLRYQAALVPANIKKLNEEIDLIFSNRASKFISMYEYLYGLLNAPDAATRASALRIFEQINAYGKNFSKLKIADQTMRYIRVLELLMKVDNAADLTKLILTDSVNELNQLQLDYEGLYMERGNMSVAKIAPTSLRKEMVAALKLHFDEVNWMASQFEIEPWHTLCMNISKRYDELNGSMVRKPMAEVKKDNLPSTSAPQV